MLWRFARTSIIQTFTIFIKERQLPSMLKIKSNCGALSIFCACAPLREQWTPSIGGQGIVGHWETVWVDLSRKRRNLWSCNTVVQIKALFSDSFKRLCSSAASDNSLAIFYAIQFVSWTINTKLLRYVKYTYLVHPLTMIKANLQMVLIVGNVHVLVYSQNLLWLMTAKTKCLNNVEVDWGEGQLKSGTSSRPLQFWVQQKASPTIFSNTICHVSLKFKHFSNNRQLKWFLIKLLLTSQSFLLKFGLFRLFLSVFIFNLY